MIAFALARASSAAFLKRRVTTDVRDFFFPMLRSFDACVYMYIYMYIHMGDRCDRKTARTVTERNP